VRAFTLGWGRVAVLVCEDAWHTLTGTIAALDGAEVVFVCAAAPARGVWPRGDDVPGPASVARWERLIRDLAEEHGVYACLANLVGSEGGKTFGGTSVVVGPTGEVRARAPMHDEAVVVATLDLGDIARARADVPLLSDLRTMLPHLTLQLARSQSGRPPSVPPRYDAAPRDRVPAVVETDAAPGSAAGGTEGGGPAATGDVAGDVVAGDDAPGLPAGTARGAPPSRQNTAATTLADRHHAIAVVRADLRDAGGPSPLAIDPAMVEQWLVTFVRDELARRGFSRAVLGLSGGVDSAVTAALAARALGPANVVGIRLPYRTSSRESLDHAHLVTEALGIEERTIDISAAVDGYLANEPDADAARRGNVMARMRMIAIFDLSAKHRALPLGTGNKTERLFGYFTWHADDSPPVNPLGDLFKTQVWTLARHLGVPEVIVGKPASADLIQGQTDEGDFGISYTRADVILNWLLSGYTPADLAARGFDATEVELVRRRLEGTHWKRKLPTVAMLSPTAIGESYLRPVDY
jgi:NAD+ synthetase